MAARGQETAGLLIADAQAALRREAGLLARDAALVEGVAKRDWATLVRGVSPRLTDLTLEGIADLVVILDETGSVILQAPPQTQSALANPMALATAPPSLISVGDRPYIIASAQVRLPGESPNGFVLVARRLENIAPALGSYVSHIAVCHRGAMIEEKGNGQDGPLAVWDAMCRLEQRLREQRR